MGSHPERRLEEIFRISEELVRRRRDPSFDGYSRELIERRLEALRPAAPNRAGLLARLTEVMARIEEPEETALRQAVMRCAHGIPTVAQWTLLEDTLGPGWLDLLDTGMLTEVDGALRQKRADEKRARVAARQAAETVRALDALEQSHRALEAAREALSEAVHGARRCNATWSQIGQRLGVSAQAAHSRFRKTADRRPDRKGPV